jgi:hypothetical protein
MIDSPFTKLALRPVDEANPRIRRMRRLEQSVVEIETDEGVARVFTQTLVEIEIADDVRDVSDTERPIAADW